MIKNQEIIIDSFAGGGGASLGIEMAIGRGPDIAINHDHEAIAMHMANHPRTQHYSENVWDVDPVKAVAGRPVGLAWFSPDCTFHSKARGGKPFRDRNKARRRRGLAWVVVRWAKAVRPRVIMLENVEEFQDWGPLLDDGTPCPLRKGLTFRRWKKNLENIGYAVEFRELRACDYGAPTIRKRLFVIARCDGLPISWPKPTHGPGTNQPYRTAAECIDWSLPCPSIFERARPLAEATMRRIAKGVKRYVIDAADPFIVPITHTGGDRVHSVREPLRTITTAHRGELALAIPSLVGVGGRMGQSRPRSVDEPMQTITAKADTVVVAPVLSSMYSERRENDDRCSSLDKPAPTVTASQRHALLVPTLIQSGYGEREGQEPRALDIHKPLGTVVAGGVKHALVAAFLAQHNTERGNNVKAGRDVRMPISTITARGTQQQLVTSHLTKLYGTCKDGQDNREPMPTITSGGQHIGEVRAFLIKYYGTDQDPQLREPLHTVTTKHRFGIVTVKGEDYVIADIGMRMLQPRELYRAQGFPDSYIIDLEVNGKRLTKTAQVRMCGNSVCPPIAAALIRANMVAAAEAAA